MAIPLHVLVVFIALPSSMIILCLISLAINAFYGSLSPKVAPPSREPDPEMGNGALEAEQASIPPPSEDMPPATSVPDAASGDAGPAANVACNAMPSADATPSGALQPLGSAAKLQPLPGSPSKLGALPVVPGGASPLPRPGALPPLPSAS